ncbi:hypothetical protein GCM10027064_01170 [Microbacterium petrolearium]|jgi:hypothetical protein
MTENIDTRTTPAIRWAAIVWGALLAAVAVAGIAILAAPELALALNESVSALLLQAEVGWILALVLMALGIAIAIGGLVLALRRSAKVPSAT